MSGGKVLLLVAVVLFLAAFVGIDFQGRSLIPLGLAAFAAAGLVG